MTCTFKNDTAPTGLARVSWTKGCEVKFKKKVCGRIYPPSLWTKEGQYKLALRVKNETSWRWVELKARFDSLSEAKEWCKENWGKIMEKYDLHFQEE